MAGGAAVDSELPAGGSAADRADRFRTERLPEQGAALREWAGLSPEEGASSCSFLEGDCGRRDGSGSCGGGRGGGSSFEAGHVSLGETPPEGISPDFKDGAGGGGSGGLSGSAAGAAATAGVAAADASAELLQGEISRRLEAQLHRAICAVTAHLETFVKQQICESHDGIANRIEDVVAEHVARARAAPPPAVKAAADTELASARGQKTASADVQVGSRAAADCASLRKQMEKLEGLVTRIAATTARDAAAAKTESAAELRGLGGSVRLALDRFEAELSGVRQVQEEHKLAIVEEHERLRDWVRAELASRDAAQEWLDELRVWVATELEGLHKHLTLGDDSGRKHLLSLAALAAAVTAAAPSKNSRVARLPQRIHPDRSPRSHIVGSDAGDAAASAVPSDATPDVTSRLAPAGRAVAILAEWLADPSAVQGQQPEPSPELVHGAALEVAASCGEDNRSDCGGAVATDPRQAQGGVVL